VHVGVADHNGEHEPADKLRDGVLHCHQPEFQDEDNVWLVVAVTSLAESPRNTSWDELQTLVTISYLDSRLDRSIEHSFMAKIAPL
jgi:hypothetical protein